MLTTIAINISTDFNYTEYSHSFISTNFEYKL